MRFINEPDFTHGTSPTGPQTALLLCNLGTPDAATPSAVRRYLAEFLADRRVVEIPRLLWLLILHGIILRIRPAKSAEKYARVWTTEGSPLRVWTQKQSKLLQGYLGERGHRVAVRYAMRYGDPSISSVLSELKRDGARRILILPLYPQYSGPTTASVCDAVYQWGQLTRSLPEFRFVNHYHDDPGYITALTKRIRDYWQTNGRAEKLVLSFHGVPERTLLLGDPYHCECRKTARLLGESLGMNKDQVVITFQSRFGKAKWLQPYTEPTLIALAQQGLQRVDVACPGFTSDCLETLEEIGMEARDAFLRSGGKEFHYIPCLNDQHEWIAALCNVAIRHLQGWDTNGAIDEKLLVNQRLRALDVGATK